MRSSDLKASLIITTYNWPEALRLTLYSVIRQTRPPDEIIVADDGSGPETAKTVEELLRPSGIPWRHVWHDDKGVRQSRIKNLAVKYAREPYLILIDHDVILHPDFISDHLSMVRKNVFLLGKRSLLPEHYTRKILADGFLMPPSPWIRGLGNRKNTFRLPALGKLLAKIKTIETSHRGCNLSMFRDDFIKVNGFDEAFDRSWGREDSDICYRLFHCGLRMINLWFIALQYHLHHELITNWDRERLDGELKRNRDEKRVKALKGLSQLTSEGKVVAASNWDTDKHR